MRVPVVDKNKTPLMPCKPSKVRKLMHNGQAIGKYNKLGIFYIQLTYVVEKPDNQRLVVGVDPGSKFEGYSVNGEQETVLNLMAEATDGKAIKKKLERRRTMRRARRHRKWRRPARFNNRHMGDSRISPSTRARWELKFRVIQQLAKILPITDVSIEDVKVKTRKNGKQWNTAFSPVQAGKNHLYNLVRKAGFRLFTFSGWETKEARDELGLKKSSDKGKQSFESHAVDAFALSALIIGIEKPTTKALYYVKQIKLYRRQLHRLQFSKGGIRKPYGGTRSLGLKRGTLVKHPKWGLTSVGGSSKNRISLHDYQTNKRLTQRAKSEDCLVLTSTPYRSRLVNP